MKAVTAATCPSRGTELKAYMEPAFGATVFGKVGRRDSYVFVVVKGQATPFSESSTSEGAVSDNKVPVACADCYAYAFSYTCPELTVEATSAGFDDGNSASFDMSETHSSSWVDRGVNIIVLDSNHMEKDHSLVQVRRGV